MQLSKLQVGILGGGVLVLAFLAVSVFSGNLLGINSRSLGAEVILGATGLQRTGQVTFWADGATVTGDGGLVWDNTKKVLTVNSLQSNSLLSTAPISLYPGVGQPTDSRTIYLQGKVSVNGAGSPSQSMDILGGLRLRDTGVKPSCVNQSNLGTFWFTYGSGTKDKVEVCARDVNGVAAWRTIY